MRVLVAYSATLVNGAETHPGTLFLIESDDSGGTWSTPRTVWTRDGMEAIEPQFVVAPSGRAHLIWRDARPNQIGEGGVWHVESSDGAATWGRPARGTLPMIANRIRAVVDACDAVHVVAQAHGDRTARIAYVRFTGGRWDSPQLLFDGMMGMHPSIKLDESGNVALTFSRVVPGSPSGAGVKAGLVGALLPVRRGNTHSGGDSAIRVSLGVAGVEAAPPAATVDFRVYVGPGLY